MNLRASSFLILPALALLAAGCATSNPARSTEVDDVYFSSSDRITPRYEATASAAPPAYDPTAPPAADGSVPNPDYTGQQDAGQQTQQNYYDGDAYAATPRVTSPYYGSFNQYNSGYAYDPFWTGSSLAIGCGPAWGWGGPMMAYAPIYVGPRVRFGVSFGYGWGYSSWAAPMYGWAGPTFYDPFYDPFWGPSYYGYGYGWGYPAYGYGGGGYYGGGWRNGYYQGFHDGVYAGGGGIRNGRRVTYGPRLERSSNGGAYAGGNRVTRRSDGERTVSAGAGGGNYQPATSGYGGGVSRAAGAGRAGNTYSAGAPAPMPSGRATRVTRQQAYSAQPQTSIPQQPVKQQPAYQQPVPQQPVSQEQPGGKMQHDQPVRAAVGEQPVPRQQPSPQVAPQPEQRQGGWFQRATRNVNTSEGNRSESRGSINRAEAPSRTYSAPSPSPRSSGGNSGGGSTRRSR